MDIEENEKNAENSNTNNISNNNNTSNNNINNNENNNHQHHKNKNDLEKIKKEYLELQQKYPNKNVFNLAGIFFIVSKKYEVIKRLGQGAYGVVCSCRDTSNNTVVAIKKIQNVFIDLIDAKRIVREVKLIHFLNHPCIIRLLDLEKPENKDNFSDIYFSTEFMDTDLHKVIYSKQQLTDTHYKYFIYQILCGINYLHSANIVHRDLKPANILINKDCQIKICDFGLARGGVEEEEKDGNFTEYVTTRWYRAPEVILTPSKYSKAVDIWSIGCIFAELLGRTPLFPGDNYLDQIKKIITVLGTPNDEDISYVENIEARNFALSKPFRTKIPFSKIYRNAEPLACDFLEKTLTFNPKKRLTAKQCLEHPYFQEVRDTNLETESNKAFDWAFDKIKPNKENLMKLLYEESLYFHNENEE